MKSQSGFIRCSIAGLTAIFLSWCTAGAATISWVNPAGGAWSNPANWDTGVPSAGDSAQITLNGSYTVTLDTSVTVSNLTVGGTFGTQTITLTTTNALVGTFLLGSNSVFNLNPGTTLNFNGAINNQGTINWGTTNTLNGFSNCTILNAGVFNLLTNFNASNFNVGKFTSTGTLQVPANAGTIVFAPNLVRFTNSGAISVGSNSTLNLQNGAMGYGSSPIVFANGTVITGAGVVIDIDAAIIATGTITLNGTFELLGGGSMQGTQLLAGNGTFNWYGGYIGNSTNNLPPNTSTTFGSNLVVNIGAAVVNSQIFTNLGVINWLGNAGTLDVADESQVIFDNYGLFVLQRPIYMSSGTSRISQFNNFGTILAPTSQSRTYMNIHYNWIFTNYGTIEVATNATFGLVSSNAVTFANGTVINCAGTFQFGNPPATSHLVANGTITVNGPLDSPYGLVSLYGAFITGTQTWTGTGSIGVGGDYGGGGFIQPGTTTFATNFHVYLSGGGFYLDGHTLNNQGIISMVYGNEIDDLGHAGTFNNYGTITVQQYLSVGSDFAISSTYTNFGSSFNNYGTIQYNGNGYLLSHWYFTNYGTISVVSNATVTMIGLNTTLNEGTVFAGGGQIELNTAHYDANFTANLIANGNIQVNTPLTFGYHTVLQGNQVWSGTGGLTWSGGSMTYPGTTTIASNLTFIIADDPKDSYTPYYTTNTYARTLGQNHVLNNQGTMIWNSTYPVQMSNQSSIVNSGLLLLQTNGLLQQVTLDCAFNNQTGGIVRVLSGTSSFNCPLTNFGTLDLQVGTLNLSNAVAINPSALCQFALGSATLAVTALNPSGVLAATLPNGYIVTNGTKFPLLTYAAHNGTFANIQLPALPPTLQWQLDYGATSLSLEAVNAPPRISSAKMLPTGTFQFTFTGAAGTNCLIQASTNLVQWVTLQSNNSFSGQINFTDTAATNFPKRFYRAIVRY